MRNPFRYFNSSPEVIRLTVMMYIRYPHECSRWLNNRVENSHQPFRRRERSIAKFRGMKTLQKFAGVMSWEPPSLAPPALMKNGKNESGQLGLKLDVQGNKGPLFDRPPWALRCDLPGT
jgi:hypothetical protein